jgi:hypothetical protein
LQPAENRSYNLLEVPDVAVERRHIHMPFWDSSTASLATCSRRFFAVNFREACILPFPLVRA